MAKQEKCATCNGKGRVYSGWGMNNDGKTCQTCKGSGKVDTSKR